MARTLYHQHHIIQERDWLPQKWWGANWFEAPIAFRTSLDIFGTPTDREIADYDVGDLLFNPATHAYYAGQITEIRKDGMMVRWEKGVDNVFHVFESWNNIATYWWADSCDQPDDKIGQCACGGCPVWYVTCAMNRS